jgi:pimeloyl-ACP methyl ester carboxylesterase
MRLSLLPITLLLAVTSFASAEDAFFDSNGVKLRYIVHGDGPPVILLHGFAANAEMWNTVAGELSKRYRVIAMDCRGHGKSDKPHDPNLYGREMIEDVVRLMDHLKIEKAHVVGYSMGAEIAGHLMIAHPDRLLSVTLGGGVPACEPTPQQLARKDLAADSLEQGKGIGPALIAGAPEGGPKPTTQLADMISRAIIGDQDQKALGASIRGSRDLQVTQEQLKANRVPALVIYGSHDGDAKNRQQYDRVAKLLNAHIRVVDGGNHGSTPQMPTFAEAVAEFL